jgi:hypothetical protein
VDSLLDWNNFAEAADRIFAVDAARLEPENGPIRYWPAMRGDRRHEGD